MEVFRGRVVPLDEAYDLATYRELVVRMLDQGYRFVPFTLDVVEPGDDPAAFLRHDIDYSLTCAVKMAAINAGLGVKGTFFIRVRSTSYNCLAPPSREALRRIAEEHGQHIALHFSVDGGTLSRETLRERLVEDFAILKRVAPDAVSVFSWHNPAATFEDGEDIMRADIPGFVNAYGRFAGGMHPYVAESNMRYSVPELRAIIDRREPSLQICFAPIQWAFGKTNMVDVIAAALVQKIRDCLPEFEGNYVFTDVYGGRLQDDLLESVERLLKRSAAPLSGTR